jgi:alkylated DNA repair dioxygenase AlkB
MENTSQLVKPVTEQDLWSQGYMKVRQIVAASSVARVREYILRQPAQALSSDHQVPEAPAKYGDPVMDKLLEALGPTVESLSGRSVLPTYSYFRIYKTGDALARHTDRAACEISLSLSLGHEATSPWPLWIQGFKETAAVALEPGDAVLYLGTQCAHWREPFCGERAVQAFLHYVDRAGRFSAWKYDRRTTLSHHLQSRS